jgi:hypothetical protein
VAPFISSLIFRPSAARGRVYRIYNHGWQRGREREKVQGMPGTNKTERRNAHLDGSVVPVEFSSSPRSVQGRDGAGAVADMGKEGRQGGGGRRRGLGGVCGDDKKKGGEGGLLSAPTCLHSDGRLRVYSSSPGIFSPCVATHHLLSFFHCGTETFLSYVQQDDTSGS